MNCSVNCLANRSWFAVYDNVVTWIIGLVFLLAGVPHWGNPYFFLGSVYSYKLVEPGFGQMVASALPPVQLILAVMLLLRFLPDAAHLASFFLFACFAAVQTAAFVRGLDISCGCFGPDHESVIGWKTLSLVYSLLLLSAGRNFLLLYSQRRRKCC
jgi:hypothetical protein